MKRQERFLPISKRLLLCVLLISALLLLSACRVRTNVNPTPNSIEAEATEPTIGHSGTGAEEGQAPAETSSEETDEVPDQSEETRENRASERKEYDEAADAELIYAAESRIHTEGEGEGAATASSDAVGRVNALSSDAEKTATQTLAAEEAERQAVSEEAEEAESAFRYFTVLLQDRLRTLMECKRLNVYWECEEDGLTVHKSSAEHALILAAGCYDVSTRLTEERLHVDAGWVSRKSPDVVVKVADASVLGGAIYSDAAAKAVKQALAAREGWKELPAFRTGKVLLLSTELLDAPYLQLYAKLALAQCAYPELFTDLDLSEALQMLSEEATGRLTEAIYSSAGL